MIAHIRMQMTLTAALGLLLGLVSSASAQTSLAEMNATMSGMNTLNGGPVGGGGYYRSAYMAPAPNPAAPLGLYGAPPGAPGAPPLEPTSLAPPPIKKILVLTGEQVKCRVTGAVLEDIHYEYRPESEKGEYYDDGTHGDLQANDNIYTNISDRYDVLSAEANRFKLLYLRMLEVCEQTNPLEFFRIPVATEEPLSTLPRLSDQEKDRDETFLRQWHRQFLAKYRTDPEDPMSDFYPIFVPSPPRSPETPSPPNDQFNVNAIFLDSTLQQIITNATASAVETPQDQTVGTTTRGSTRATRGSSAGESGRSSSAVTGDRWGQLRQDARTYGAEYGAGSSRYFRSERR